jgi:hypothetical protein
VAAAKQIRHALRVLAASGRCLVTMKRFYVSVVAAQRHAKGFVQCLLARRTLLAKQVDACYQAIWAMGASRRSIRNGKIELKSPVKRRVVVRSLEEADVAEIVRTHIRATRRQNIAGMARRTKAKEDRAEQRRRFKTQCIREAEAQDRPDPTWRDVHHYVEQQMSSLPLPPRPMVYAVAPHEVLAAQLRGLIGKIETAEGLPNPTDMMIAVPPREQVALAAFQRRCAEEMQAAETRRQVAAATRAPSKSRTRGAKGSQGYYDLFPSPSTLLLS